MTINTPWNWSSPLSGFPLSRLSKITLSNTGSAMVNGQNSVAGSVNFVLPSGKSHKGFTLGMETGGEGTRHIDVMYGFEDGDNQHLIGIFSDKYDGTRRFTDGSWYKNSRDNRMLYYKGQIALSHGWLFKTTIMHNEGSITCGDAWGGNFERFDPWRLSLRSYALFKDFGNESNFTLRYARYNDYSRDVYYTDGTFTTVQNPGQEDGYTNVNMKTWEALYNFKANDKNYINIGVVNQKVSDSHDSLSKDFQNIEHDNTSFFIADSLRATDKLNIHLVARSDEDYEGERATSYSVNTNYDVNDKFSIGAGYSHTIQLPTLQDLYRANSRNGNWRGIVGNPNLENEKSNSYEFRIGYKANDRWNLNLTGYRYNIDDMVGVKTAGELGLAGQDGWFRDRYGNNLQFANNTEVATNIDEAVIQGYELGARGKLSDSFNIALSYTNFKKAEDKTTKVRLESVPDYRATMALEYCHEKTTAVLSLSHQGKTKARPGNNVTTLDSSTLCNFYIRQQCNKDFAVYLKIANVGNKKDAVLSQFVLGNHNANGTNGYFYEDGRVITLGMELKCD